MSRDTITDRISALEEKIPFLELFARGARSNWAVWGNQADDDYEPTWKTYAHHSRANKIEAG